MGIDIGLLPPLTVIKQMTHEEIQAEMVQVGKLDDVSPADAAFRPILAGSYREALLRQQADEQCRGLSLVSAQGSDLDHIGVTYYRQSDGSPVVRLDGEADDEYRIRLHESPGGLSVAGPTAAYEFHAKSAHPNIKQALCTSPKPVHITMYLLGRKGNGAVSDAECRLVEGYLETRRPLTDEVEAKSAEIIEYSVKATIYQVKNSDQDGVTARSKQSGLAYVTQQHRLKGKVTLSSLHAALQVAGVEEVVLTGWSDIRCGQHQAPYCLSLEVEFGGWGDTFDNTRPVRPPQ
ncbi:baseplate assembly protein I [Aeromonas phage 85AhydR10PP]|nr:baseplate assembly protein I [Aeromonas phage 85AhydR10PP]